MKRLVDESGAQVRVQEYSDVAKASKQRGIGIRGQFEVRLAASEEIVFPFHSFMSVSDAVHAFSPPGHQAIEHVEREIMELLQQRRHKQEVRASVRPCPALACLGLWVRRSITASIRNHRATDGPTDRMRARRRRRARWCGARRCAGSSPQSCRGC